MLVLRKLNHVVKEPGMDRVLSVTQCLELFPSCVLKIAWGMSSHAVFKGLCAGNSIRFFFRFVESKELEITRFPEGLVPCH